MIQFTRMKSGFSASSKLAGWLRVFCVLGSSLIVSVWIVGMTNTECDTGGVLKLPHSVSLIP